MQNATLHSLVTQNSYLFGQSGVFVEEIRQLHSLVAIATSLTGWPLPIGPRIENPHRLSKVAAHCSEMTSHAIWITAGALASFVFLPAADAVLGRDLVPETEVHLPHSPLAAQHVQ